MPTAITPTITNAGRAAAISASGLGLSLAITHIALGTGSYVSSSVGATMTDLATRKEKVTIASGFNNSAGGFVVSAKFPLWAGVTATYDATEIGFFAGDPDSGGTLFAVFSDTSTLIQTRTSASEFLVSLNLALTGVPAGSVTVTVDPSADAATALLAAHIAAPNPHPQYIRKLASGVALPTVNEGPIWHDDYQSVMTWQAFTANGANYTGYASRFVGRIEPDSQPTARQGQVKTGTMNLSKIAMAPLWGWAQHNGLVVPVASWTAGRPIYADNGDGTFRVPDVRAEFMRLFDDGRGIDTDRAAAFTAWETFMNASHNHAIWGDVHDGTSGSGRLPTASQQGLEAWIATEYQGGYEARPRNFAQLGSIQL